MASPAASTRKPLAVWAVNPFEAESRPQPAAIEGLKRWIEATGFQVQPVFVLYVPSSELLLEERHELLARYISTIESEVAGYLQYANLSVPSVFAAFMAPRVLIQPGGDTRDAVDILLRFALDSGASWILTSSKGRSGLRRLALGSFAERLLLSSPLPVWVFGHGAMEGRDPRRILFATDFSDESRSAFAEVLQQASRLQASIRIFHCVNLPPGMISGYGVMGMAGYIPFDEYLDGQSKWAKDVAQDWISDAHKAGVAADPVILQVVPNVAEAILAEARSMRAGVIAMASRSGPVTAAVMGSTTRQVVRQAECPVWVFGRKLVQSKQGTLSAAS